MIIKSKFTNRHYVRQITTCLLTFCLILIILSSVSVPEPKDKALDHKNVHGNGNWGAGNQGNGIDNSFTGNQGLGVGAGMANSSEPEPPEPTGQPVSFVESAPIPEEPKLTMGQCPALMELVAAELGIPKDNIQVNLENPLSDSVNIQPCNSYARLIIYAAVLGDPGQAGLAALAKVVSEFVSPTMPISEELLAEISYALSADRNSDDKPHYATAAQWLDAFVKYVVILNTQMRWSLDESVVFTMEKYVTPAKEGTDMTLLMFLHLRLQALISS